MEFVDSETDFNAPPPTPTTVVYATDRSKAVVPVLFLYGLYYGALHVLQSYSCACCPRASLFLLVL